MNTKQARLIEALESDRFAARLARANRFEQISGGGMRKKIERLLHAPGIYLPYVFCAKLGLSHLYASAITLFWGRQIRIPLTDYDALILSMYGGLHGSESNFTKFLIKNLGADDVFYDVGANIGFYTFLAVELCKEIHSFEPMAGLSETIQKNVRKNDAVIVNAIALSDTSGTVDFYVMESTMLGTIDATVAAQHSSRKVVVPTRTLDEYVQTHPKPTFLKIDAEGAEEKIVVGGSAFFASHAPVIAMEIWGKSNKWELSMGAADRLRSMGYRSFRLDSEGLVHEVSGDLSLLVPALGGENFIFKK